MASVQRTYIGRKGEAMNICYVSKQQLAAVAAPHCLTSRNTDISQVLKGLEHKFLDILILHLNKKYIMSVSMY